MGIKKARKSLADITRLYPKLLSTANMGNVFEITKKKGEKMRKEKNVYLRNYTTSIYFFLKKTNSFLTHLFPELNS